MSVTASFTTPAEPNDHPTKLEYVAGLDSQVEAIFRNQVETKPLDDFVNELGFSAVELLPEGFTELGL